MQVDTLWLEKNIFQRRLKEREKKALNKMEILHFKAYETILHEGEARGGMYILREGSIKITVKHDGEEVRLEEGHEGTLFAKDGIIDPTSSCVAEVVATSPCTVYKLSYTLFKEILKQQHELAFLLLSVIITYQEKVMREKNRLLTPVLLKLARKANSLPLAVKLIPVIFILLYILAFFTIPYRF